MRSEVRQRIQELRERDKLKQQQLIDFRNQMDNALRNAWKEPWWREVVRICTARRQSLIEQLVAGVIESRKEEERTKGMISELALILKIDDEGSRLQQS